MSTEKQCRDMGFTTNVLNGSGLQFLPFGACRMSKHACGLHQGRPAQRRSNSSAARCFHLVDRRLGCFDRPPSCGPFSVPRLPRWKSPGLSDRCVSGNRRDRQGPMALAAAAPSRSDWHYGTSRETNRPDRSWHCSALRSATVLPQLGRYQGGMSDAVARRPVGWRPCHPGD